MTLQKLLLKIAEIENEHEFFDNYLRHHTAAPPELQLELQDAKNHSKNALEELRRTMKSLAKLGTPLKVPALPKQ